MRERKFTLYAVYRKERSEIALDESGFCDRTKNYEVLDDNEFFPLVREERGEIIFRLCGEDDTHVEVLFYSYDFPRLTNARKRIPMHIGECARELKELLELSEEQ